ncbi:hypothetical protein D499_0AT00130 [Hanseniaspora uvarum DSM 2768]|nr:hypothetical protein D499_0AT00130 [Hanseniaspora uvarum DSM 2768]
MKKILSANPKKKTNNNKNRMANNNFKQIFSFNVEYAPQFTIKKFQSERTKLQVVQIFSKSSPMVEGYFAVGTEIFNDSGIPHTLEHLVFTGSEKFPYKSILDKAANLSMSSTNAWTATDQTVYTLSTAGWLGFKNVLPVYLDCLFNPTLTKEAFVTEVYHIDPFTLKDKGVVYSEMEAIENQSWFIKDLAYKRLAHPQGSGYRSETGGLTENLRSLTIEEIREYHAKNYNSENVCLIITGNVPTDELLEIVNEFDNELPEATSDKSRPFVETETAKFLQPRFNTDIIENTCQFPELDTSQGEMGLYWIASEYTNSLNDLLLTILLEYLTDGSLAVLQKTFVECDEPLANDVSYETEDFLRSVVNIYYSGVPTEKLQELKTKTLELLKDHKVDLAKIKQTLESYKLSYLSKLERNGADVLSSSVITNFLYDKDVNSETLIHGFKTLKDFEDAAGLTSEQWTELLNKWFVQNSPNIVLAEPSAELYEQSKIEKENRLNDRVNNFTAEYKNELAEKVRLADEINNTPVPDALLKKFNIEDPAKAIDFIQTTSVPMFDAEATGPDAESQEVKQLVELQKNTNIPFSVHLEQFDSNFVEINLMISSDVVKEEDNLPLFWLFCDAFTMPMNSQNGIIDYQTVVSSLKDDTLTFGIQRHVVSKYYPDTIKFKVKCTAENYSKGVEWIKKAIYDSIFDEQRINVLLDNFLSSIVESHRDGFNMLKCYMKDIFYNKRSLEKSANILSNEELLNSIKVEIEDGKFKQTVLPKLEEFRNDIIKGLDQSHVLVLGDIKKIGHDNFYRAWEKNFKVDSPLKKFPEFPDVKKHFTDVRKSFGQKSFILTTPGSDSSYLSLHANCTIGYDHPDYHIVKLLLGYLQATEGPFWTSIRGLGLAYGAWAYNYVDIHDVTFLVYRAADLIKSYEAAEKIMNDLASEEVKFDENLITGAIALYLKEVAESNNSFVNSGYAKYVKTYGLMKDPTFAEKLTEKLINVESKDLIRCVKTYLLPMFDKETGCPFIACHPTKKDEFKEYMEKRGYVVEVRELKEDEEEEEESDSEDEN